VVVESCNKEVEFYGFKKCRYLDWSSNLVGITGAKEMCSVSVSRSKALRLLVVDLHWKCGV